MSKLNLEILALQGARFVAIVPGTKRPQGVNWQHSGRSVDELSTDNWGMLLGEVSEGIGALDFDGTSACEFWQQWQGRDLPETVMWTSGGQDRFQMAIKIPPEYWTSIPTKFAVSTGEREQLEWRWGRRGQGFQSVLPPSAHPSGRSYYWLPGASPQDVPVYTATAEFIDIIHCLHSLTQQPQPDTAVDTRVDFDNHTTPVSEQRALELIILEIQQMRAGDRSARACRVGGLMRHIRTQLHADILQRLRAAGCDRSAIASARKYSQG